jgi:hypothetical protein
MATKLDSSFSKTKSFGFGSLRAEANVKNYHT